MSGRVLVVDDVLPNVKLLQAKLAQEYFDVVTATNGAEALAMVSEHNPDILLLDVMMPEMDGYEVCRIIKQNPHTTHLPVVMVTALSDPSDRLKGLECGADDFLTKPVNDVALFARVRSLVRLKMIMDEWRMRQQTSDQLGVLSADLTMPNEPATNATVLLVEDNPDDQDDMVEYLKSEQHEVARASSIAEGFEHATTGDYDLYIVSLTLAKEDGLRLVARLRGEEHTRRVPILLSVDPDDLSSTAKGLDIGATDYIIKPVDLNELTARVRTQIRRKRFQDQLRTTYQRNISLAMTDSLTGLYNRRYMLAYLDQIMRQMIVNKKQISVLMIDIDHFKRVNDTFGHSVGDEVLREIALRLSSNLRGRDMVGRLSGEEFLVIMPDSNRGVAAMVAERLREKVSSELVDTSGGHEPLKVTVSLGISCASSDENTTQALLDRADRALYASKRNGRNRTMFLGMGDLQAVVIAESEFPTS